MSSSKSTGLEDDAPRELYPDTPTPRRCQTREGGVLGAISISPPRCRTREGGVLGAISISIQHCRTREGGVPGALSVSSPRCRSREGGVQGGISISLRSTVPLLVGSCSVAGSNKEPMVPSGILGPIERPIFVLREDHVEGKPPYGCCLPM